MDKWQRGPLKRRGSAAIGDAAFIGSQVFFAQRIGSIAQSLYCTKTSFCYVESPLCGTYSEFVFKVQNLLTLTRSLMENNKAFGLSDL